MGKKGAKGRAADVRNVSQQTVCTTAAISLARRVNLLLTAVASVAARTRACSVITLVDLGVGVTQLDGDVADQLVLESNCLDTGDGLDNGGLSVSDMANGADVDGGLSSDNLGGERRQDGNIEILGIGLWGQRGFFDRLVGDDGVGLLDGGLESLFFDGVVLGVDGLSRVRVGRNVVVFRIVRHGG